MSLNRYRNQAGSVITNPPTEILNRFAVLGLDIASNVVVNRQDFELHSVPRNQVANFQGLNLPPPLNPRTV
jgi:hypothetical protein